MNIYVGNLPYNATEQELLGIFQRFGKVTSIAVVVDKRTNRSRGYGFVDMPDDNQALKAIRELDGSDFKGRSLRVDQSQPRTDRRQSTRDRRMSPSRRTEDLRANPRQTSSQAAAVGGGLMGFLRRLLRG